MSNENTDTAIVAVNPYLPAMNIEQVIDRRNAVVQFVKRVMVEDVDYGIIPGTKKQTLLKPGAEKLNTLFGLTTRFVVVSSTEDWTGKDFNGEPFFSYDYRCQLWRGNLLIAESDGNANSFEKKYRYREAQRKCPNCGATAIIKGREEYGGGWICFNKKGGCGSKFGDNAPEIVNQVVGQIINPDICDMPNTLRKMAQKRALVGTTLIAVNASEFFTQDMEDISYGDVITSTARNVEKGEQTTTTNKPAQPERDPVAATAAKLGGTIRTEPITQAPAPKVAAAGESLDAKRQRLVSTLNKANADLASAGLLDVLDETKLTSNDNFAAIEAKIARAETAVAKALITA